MPNQLAGSLGAAFTNPDYLLPLVEPNEGAPAALNGSPGLGMQASTGARLQASWIARPPVAASRGMQNQFFDFYFRVWIVPGRIDFGFLVGNDEADILLWNAYLDDKTLTDITPQNDDGLALSGPGVGTLFPALHTADYRLTVDITQSEAIIRGSYLFVLGGDDTLLRVIGRVSALLDFPPDWSRPVQETSEYLTDIRFSRNRTEQRRALRSKPRQFLEYRLVVRGSDLARFEYITWAAQARLVTVPLWPQINYLAQDVSAGSVTLPLTLPLYREFGPDFVVVLMAPGQAATAVTLMAKDLNAGTITADRPLAATWPAGTRVYPTWLMNLPGSLSTRRPTSAVMEATVRLNRYVDTAPPLPFSQTPDMTVDGMEALIRRVNWADPMNVDMVFESDYLDADVGPYVFEPIGDMAHRVRKATVVCRSRAEVEWWQAFIDRQRGRLREFIVPTWQHDLDLIPVSTPGHFFEVQGTELAQYMPLNTTYSHVFVRKQGGDPAFYRINGIEADGVNNSTRILTEPWGEAYPTTDAELVCFATQVRLAADNLVVEWLTDEVAEITFGVITLGPRP